MDAMEASLKLLSRRARSEREIDEHLRGRGFSEAVRADVVGRLRGLGYLDDAKLALDQTTRWLESGRWGPEGVLRRLEARGISPEAAAAALAMATVELGYAPARAARALLGAKRIPCPPKAPRDRAKAERLLAARGFSLELVDEWGADG